MSSHERLLNAHKLHASGLDSQGAATRVGIVVQIAPDGATAKVRILPDNTLSGWLPIGQVSVGRNTIISPPSPGDQVELTPLEGDAENWLITGRFFTASAPAPNSPATNAPVAPGQLAVVMHDGSYFHFTNDGTLHTGGTEWRHAGNIKLTSGNITLDSGNVTVSGNVSAQGDVSDGHGSLDRLRGNYNKHKHGGAITDSPDPE